MDGPVHHGKEGGGVHFAFPLKTVRKYMVARISGLDMLTRVKTYITS
jgi:hypothetical protein